MLKDRRQLPPLAHLHTTAMDAAAFGWRWKGWITTGISLFSGVSAGFVAWKGVKVGVNAAVGGAARKAAKEAGKAAAKKAGEVVGKEAAREAARKVLETTAGKAVAAVCQTAMETGTRVAASAGVGMVVAGGVSVTRGRRSLHVSRDGVLHGREDGHVDVTSVARDFYHMAAVSVPLITALKRCLIAWNAYVDWLQHYEEYLDVHRFAAMLDRFNTQLHLRGTWRFACSTRAGFLQVLDRLLGDDVLAMINAFAPAELFAVDAAGALVFTDPSIPLSGAATTKFIGSMQAMLGVFADHVLKLRAQLHARMGNGYMSCPEVISVWRELGEDDRGALKAALNRLAGRDELTMVLSVLSTHLATAGVDAPLEHEWYLELTHLQTIARETAQKIGVVLAPRP